MKYSSEGSATILWFGDLETDFMKEVKDELTMKPADILFAPHHGRDTGKVPSKWLGEIDPGIVVVGEAPPRNRCCRRSALRVSKLL